MFQFLILPTDVVIWGLMVGLVGYVWWVLRDADRKANWVKVFRDPAPMSAAVVFAFFGLFTLLDSVHFRRELPSAVGQTSKVAYSPRGESLLDLMLAAPLAMREKSYSAPLSVYLFGKETSEDAKGQPVRDFPRLEFAGKHLKDPAQEQLIDQLTRASVGAIVGLFGSLFLLAGMAFWQAHQGKTSVLQAAGDIAKNDTDTPWRAAAITSALLCMLTGATAALMGHYHVLGTDRTGNDVLVQALKSVRTAFVIGTLSTVATLPLAIVFGVAAGYFKGWVDDVIQYIYTTLSSIPAILLIAACVLMAQVFIDQNPDLFEVSLQRSDLRIFILCLILGLTLPLDSR